MRSMSYTIADLKDATYLKSENWNEIFCVKKYIENKICINNYSFFFRKNSSIIHMY